MRVIINVIIIMIIYINTVINYIYTRNESNIEDLS